MQSLKFMCIGNQLNEPPKASEQWPRRAHKSVVLFNTHRKRFSLQRPLPNLDKSRWFRQFIVTNFYKFNLLLWPAEKQQITARLEMVLSDLYIVNVTVGASCHRKCPGRVLATGECVHWMCSLCLASSASYVSLCNRTVWNWPNRNTQPGKQKAHKYFASNLDSLSSWFTLEQLPSDGLCAL